MEYLMLLIGGAINIYVTSYINGSIKNNLLFSFIYGLFLYGIPLFICYKYTNGYPYATIGLGLAIYSLDSVNKMIRGGTFNLPRVLQDSKLLLLLITIPTTINFVFSIFFAYKIFDIYGYFGFAHLWIAIAIVVVFKTFKNNAVQLIFNNAYSHLIVCLFLIWYFLKIW
jgi:hypothetical protein